ncbi:NAD(P)-binding protein [Hymenopellis radicata]|nr:NAD(P)-binding protein [Hymenopellis radicata]
MPGFNPKTDLVDLQGKVAIVTGGNRGVGLATVRHLACAGAKVYLAARDEGHAMAAIEEIKKDSGAGEVVWLKLDAAEPQKAKDAALEFMQKETRLDIVVNNAGMMTGPYETGLDGMSTMVIVNYLSPFVFTQTLLPILRSTAEQPDSDVRIVNVSSMMHRYAPAPLRIDAYDDLSVSYDNRRFSSWLRYAHSKLLIILWTKALQDHLSSSNITAIAIHPGGVNTFGASFPFFLRPLLIWVLADAEHGAYNSVFAAAGKEVKEDRERFRGVYVEPTLVGKQPAVREPAKMALDEGLRKDLWEKTLGYTQRVGLV